METYTNTKEKVTQTGCVHSSFCYFSVPFILLQDINARSFTGDKKKLIITNHSAFFAAKKHRMLTCQSACTEQSASLNLLCAFEKMIILLQGIILQLPACVCITCSRTLRESCYTWHNRLIKIGYFICHFRSRFCSKRKMILLV